MKIFALGPVEQDAVGVDQCELSAIAEEGDRSAFCDENLQVLRQDALDAGVFYPRQFFDFSAACIQRNSQHTTVAIVDEQLLHVFAGDNVVSVHFNLIRFQQ